ncbi:glycosyltransferase family 87 protein [Streptacidiphilus sp. P02-A3a]|uniref:glycosyltransferase family 87 protein n=1 Tax=Streptacidiphilus sp. P02-A3a TaxID=2704468 RepID=UPI0015F9B4A1|nr:glycosyltransferase family 87 protein [Streptacidiphilus sp. P02-A3a]QMU72846.1 DUF2029 domain-containing protein [Streptacidiphilus sp. P02-A3a]
MTTTHVPEAARPTTAVSPEAHDAEREPSAPDTARPARPQRRLWVLGCLVCAVWAGCFPIVSNLRPEQNWGLIAFIGYLLATGAAAFAPLRLVPRLVVGTALLGAVLVPLPVMLAQGWAQSEVQVVQYSATQLLHTGSPYIPHPRQVTQYDPYLPAMALFGLPRALLGSHGALPRVLGDARLWFLAAFLGCLLPGWRLLRPRTPGADRARTPGADRARTPGADRARTPGTDRARTPGADHSRGLLALAAVTASPLVALSAAVSGVDLPLIGCCLLGLGYAGRGHALRAGLVIALACALKWTAWPAFPVALLLLQFRFGLRPVLRCAAATLLVAGALILPFTLVTPGAVMEQVVRFPLGLAQLRTPANSPLPGHLLAELGPGGRVASLVLLGLGGVAVALWLLLRPPAGVVQAADRLAAGVAVAFLLAPAGRFGYLDLPLLLLLWPRLATGVLRAASEPRRGRGPEPEQPGRLGIVSQEDVVVALDS